MCQCDIAPMKTAYLRQDCFLHADIRPDTMPEETHLKDKLYRDLAAMQRTWYSWGRLAWTSNEGNEEEEDIRVIIMFFRNKYTQIAG